MRVTALEDRVEADLRCGDAQPLVPEVRELVAARRWGRRDRRRDRGAGGAAHRPGGTPRRRTPGGPARNTPGRYAMT
ncbi:hypothetical protein [Actinoplanes sandaracinus]|uniref:hypothetical protein n=1 Tax=Actinoplanes sandaracinus TaxID=3045177 RepID=UPI0038991565